MKKRVAAFLAICHLPFFIIRVCAQYPSQNITLLSHWDTATTIAEPYYHIRYNSVWGWKDSQDNKEYAIIGSSDGTYFIDVTNPAVPVVRDYVPGRRDSCIWREYKTYQNYLYAVSDDAVNAVNQNSMQIIDLAPLPDSVHVVYDQDTLASRTHSLFIDEQNAKLYLNSVYLPNHGGHSNMAVCSLANPAAPTLLRMLEQDYPASDNVHDCFVKNDTCYASSSYGGLVIFKLNTINHLSMIGSFTNYEQGGAYNHNSALTADCKTVIFADEVPVNLTLKSIDVSNLANITLLDTFRSTPNTTATPHNVFIPNGSNTRSVVAYYQDGVQIFDISNPSNVTRTGYFDCAPANCPTCPYPDYSGCWGVYVDLPSGIILASDMQDGLFVLDASAAMGIQNFSPDQNSMEVFPNPFSNNFQVNFSFTSSEKISYELSDITGKTVVKKQADIPPGKSSLVIDGKNLSAGSYMLTVKGANTSLAKKLIKK